MSHHSLMLPQPIAASPNPSFSAWIKSHALLFVGQVIGLIYTVATFTYYLFGAYQHAHDSVDFKYLNQHLLLVLDCAHLVFILCFMWMLNSVLDDNDNGRYHARTVQEHVFNERLTREEQDDLLSAGQDRIKEFKRYFLSFWIAMFALYLAFLLKHLLELDSPAITWTTVSELVMGSIFPFLTFALNNVSSWCLFLCFTVLYLPAPDEDSIRRRRRLVRHSAFVLSILIVLFPLVIFGQTSKIIHAGGPQNYFVLFDAVSGTLNALVAAMLIARLDSKLIGLRSWLILILYSYSAVQPLFAVFELPETVFQVIQTFVLIAVFLSKVYLFLIIYYALQTGRLLNFVYCFPILSRLIDAIFENQFEIKEERESEDSFRFFVTNDDKRAYATDKSFENREDCETHIEKLRDAARNMASYVPKEKYGTRWVEIVAFGEVLCHSADLRSAREVKQLIQESIQKLPYCKYLHG